MFSHVSRPSLLGGKDWLVTQWQTAHGLAAAHLARRMGAFWNDASSEKVYPAKGPFLASRGAKVLVRYTYIKALSHDARVNQSRYRGYNHVRVPVNCSRDQSTGFSRTLS